MARPKKKGVDYFPHTCISGKTMFIIEQRFGNDGYAFWFKLLEYIGTQEDHFIDCNKIEEMAFLQAKTRLSEEMVCSILDLLAGLQAIDAELWSKKMIWCQNFVDGVADVYINRRVDKPRKPTIDVVSTAQNPEELPVSTSKSTQSKVKESKVNKIESKVNNSGDDSKASNGEKKTEKLFEGMPPEPDQSIIGQMWGVWKITFPRYTADKENDFQGLGKILSFMCRQANNHDPTDNEFQIKTLNTFQIIADQVSKDEFWVNKSLKSIANNIQEFYNKIKNPVNGTESKSKKGSNGAATREELNRLYAERFGKGG
jgi:hypothetical protein